MKNSYFLLTFLLATSHGLAQRYVDIAKLSYGNTSKNYFKDSDSSTQVKEVGVDLTLPLVINTTHTLLTGLIYDRTETKLFETGPVETLIITGLRVGMSVNYSATWSGTYFLIPKLASDFETITSKDFQLGAIVLMKYHKNKNANYRFGAYYNTELFGPMLVPLVGMYFLSTNKKLEVSLTMPFIADVTYQVNSRLSTSINFLGQVRSYHLSQVPETDQAGYVVKASNDLFAGLKINITRQVSLHTKIGRSFGRSYRVYDESDTILLGSALIRIGDERKQLNTDFSNGLVYQVSVAYRFHQE